MPILWERTLTIYVDVPDSWLDGNGQDSDTARELGWIELVDEVRKAVTGIYPTRRFTHPTFDVNWTDQPERKDK